MFKVGDEVICNTNIIKDLIYNKRYVISTISTLYKRDYIYVVGNNVPYPSDFFIEINKLRKEKLKKICSKLEMK